MQLKLVRPFCLGTRVRKQQNVIKTWGTPTHLKSTSQVALVMFRHASTTMTLSYGGCRKSRSGARGRPCHDTNAIDAAKVGNQMLSIFKDLESRPLGPLELQAPLQQPRRLTQREEDAETAGADDKTAVGRGSRVELDS